MQTSSPGQRERAMSAGDDESNQKANRNSNGGGGRRSSHSQGPYHRYSYDNGGSPEADNAEQDKIWICAILVTIWLLMITAGFFLLFYLYILEWDPVIADSVEVFGLGLAVTILYIVFIIDICVGIFILLSQKDYVKPHNNKIFCIAIVILILNLLHGIFIWLWVWTGEYPRSCAKNTFYYGKHCIDIEMIIKTNKDSDETLSLATCKCDYGQCLPECKGLREVQNYFWGTYVLVFLRLVVLVMLLRPLRRALCECQWCCCKDSARMEEGDTRRVSQGPYPPDVQDDGTSGKGGYKSSGKIPSGLSETNNNSTISGAGGDKSKTNGAVNGGRNFGDGNSKGSKDGYDSESASRRPAKQSEMTYGLNDYNRYSEDGTFTGSTIKGDGAGRDRYASYKRPPREGQMKHGFAKNKRYSGDETIKGTDTMTNGLTEYKRYSEDGTFTGTTIKGAAGGGSGQDPRCSRAKDPDNIIYASECTRQPEQKKIIYAKECARESEPGKIIYAKECARESEPGKIIYAKECARESEPGKIIYGWECTNPTEARKTAHEGSECTRARESSAMTNGSTDYKRYSEDGTFTGTTINGAAGGGEDTRCTRPPPKERKMSYGFNEYKRNSADGTFTGTTIRETRTSAGQGKCTRAKDSRKTSHDSTEYKRYSKDGTFTSTTMKETVPSQGSECTRTPNQSESSAYTTYTDYTNYTRNSADGTDTGTTVQESVKTGDGCGRVITIVPKREIIHSRPTDSPVKKEPGGKTDQGTC